MKKILLILLSCFLYVCSYSQTVNTRPQQEKLTDDSITKYTVNTGRKLTQAVDGYVRLQALLSDSASLADSITVVRSLLSTFFKEYGNSFSAPAIFGTTDNHSLHFYTNNLDRGSIDSNGTFLFNSRLFIADRASNITSAYDTSKFTFDLGSTNSFITGNKAFVQGENNYISAPTNTYIRGGINTVRALSGGQHVYVDGRSNDIGDSTSTMAYVFVRGKGNIARLNGFGMNFKHINGNDNIVWLKNNSFVASFIHGSANTDSSNNSGENYGSSIIGSNWVNRHKGTFYIGFPGSGRTSVGYTSMQDYETVLSSLGIIKFFPNNVRNAGIIGLTGNWVLGDTVDNTTDKLQVRGSANVTTNLSVGRTIKLPQYHNILAAGKVLTVGLGDTLVSIPTDTTFNPHGLTLADFAVLPDYKRIPWVSHTSGSHTITAPSGTFTATDTGKVIYIPRGTQYLAYSTDTLGVTGKINGFISSSSVTIDSNISITGIDSMAYFGTNWYDTIQYITNYCASHNVGRLMADGAGTYLMCPKLSRVAATQSPEIRGIQITAPLVIEGAGYNTTFFKWSVEDDIHINTANNYQWHGFIDYTNGGTELRNMTILSPDRPCLSYTPADSSGAAVTIPSGFKQGSTVLRNVRIIGDSIGKKPNWKLSWPNAVQVSSSDTLGTYTLNIENTVLQSAYQNISYFEPRGGKKNLVMNHVKTYNSGSPLMGTLFINAATIANGSPTLTLHSTPSNPNPSWYKFTSGIGLSRQYMLYLYNGVDTFSARMLTVVNDTVVTLDRNATHAFTLANMQSKGVQNINYGEGQNMYVHPTISRYLNDVEIIDAYGLAMQCYSSHGNLPGTAEYAYYINCRSTVGPDGYTDLGWLLGNGNKLAKTPQLVDCDLQIYSLGYPMQIQAWNCNFRKLSPFYDTSSLNGCHGSIYVTGSPMQMNIYGGGFSNIYIHQLDSGTTNIFADSVTLIANNSTHNGVVNVGRGTTIGTTTGVGTIHYIGPEQDTAAGSWQATNASVNTKLLSYLPKANQGATTTVYHGNASGNGSFSAVSLTNDITGNLPVANLNSGTSASSTTFWCGDATWKAPVTAGNGLGQVGNTLYFDTANWAHSWTKLQTFATAYTSGVMSIGSLSGGNPSSPAPFTMSASGVVIARVTNVGLGIGSNFTPSAFIEARGTTEQIRASYDASNYVSTTVGSTGSVTYDAVGSGAKFTYNDNVNIGGDLLLTTAGNKLHIKSGANGSINTATLSSGTVTVNTTAVTANSLIWVQYNTFSGTTGQLAVPTASIVPGTSFVINSSSGSDNSTVNWIIIDNQ